ncbi:MAG: FkbM family methyltransferase [Gammaproteobacteria bacterium]|nr:FkbM family methyltransferase [Gammaproteobacteria bacterium]
MKINRPLRKVKLLLVKLLFWAPLSVKSFRRWIFDSAPMNTLMISNCINENFIVSSSDKTIARGLFSNKEFDLDKLTAALKILQFDKKHSLLIDIGANIGTICIPAIKRGYFDEAIAIEPDPFNYRLLKANVLINDLNSQIDTYNIALGKDDGEQLVLEQSVDNFGDHRIMVDENNGDSSLQKIKVKSESLDSIFDASVEKNVLVWMDTQGYEGYVLAGASSTISKKIPLVIEFWPFGMLRTKSYVYLKKTLLDGGYTKFYLLDDEPEATILSEAALDELWEKLGEKGEFSDLLVI